MPEGPRRASAEAPQQDPAARAGSIARPEEVSAFRMTRRRRSSSAAKGPSQPEKTPIDAVRAMEPAAPSSSPVEGSEDEERPGELAFLLPPLADLASMQLSMYCCAVKTAAAAVQIRRLPC